MEYTNKIFLSNTKKVSLAPHKETVYAFLVVVFMVFPSQLALNNPWIKIVNLGLFIYVILGSFIILISSKTKFNIPISFITILCALIVSSLISAQINSWSNPLISYGGFAAVLLVTLTLFSDIKIEALILDRFVMGVAICTFIIIAVSFIVNSLTMFRYEGIFNNPNSMGWFTNSSCALIIGALYSFGNRMSHKKHIFLWIIFLLCFTYLLASNSRAALGALILTIAVTTIFVPFSRQLIIRRKYIYRRRKGIYLLIILSLLFFCFYAFGAFDYTISKFQAKIATELYSGRVSSWSIALEQWTWFGHGDHAQVIEWMMDVRGGHNTYLSQLTKYGLIPAMLYFSLIFIIWLKAYKYSIYYNCESATILLTVLTAFLANAIFETGARTPGIWQGIVLFAILNYKINKTGNIKI